MEEKVEININPYDFAGAFLDPKCPELLEVEKTLGLVMKSQYLMNAFNEPKRDESRVLLESIEPDFGGVKIDAKREKFILQDPPAPKETTKEGERNEEKFETLQEIKRRVQLRQ